MKLLNNWRDIIFKAWSARLWWAAGLLQMVSFALDLGSGIGPWWLRLLLQAASIALSLAGIYARIVLQKGLSDGRNPA